MNKELRERLPSLKREVTDFMKDESGVVSKEKVLQTGIVMGGLTLAMSYADAGAPGHSSDNTVCNHDNDGCTYSDSGTSHTNTISDSWAGNCADGSHSNSCSHGSNFTGHSNDCIGHASHSSY